MKSINSFEQEGDVITLPAPYAVDGGDGMAVGALFGIAANKAASGAPVECCTTGVFRIAADSALTGAPGAPAYWDSVNRRCASSGIPIGNLVATKLAGVTVATVRVVGPAPGTVDSAGQNFSLVGAIRDYTDLVQAAADTATADRTIKLAIVPGTTITLEAPVSINTATFAFDGQGSTIQAGNITGNNKALTLTYSHVDYNGYKRYAMSPMVLERFHLLGPGYNSAANIAAGNGTSGIYTNGSVVGVTRAVRPVIRDFIVSGFDVAFDQNDASFLGYLENYTAHDCGVDVRQRAATDSGELLRIMGGLSVRNRLAYLLEDGSSEILVIGRSIDYGRQVCVIRTGGSWGRLTLRDCHWETRGAYDGSDSVGYVIEGTGLVADAIIPGRDSCFDVDGSGSLILVDGGLADLNANGLPGGSQPWTTLSHLVKTRHKNAGVVFNNCSPQSLANSAQLLATGPGHVRWRGGQLMFPSANTLPARLSDNPEQNRVFDSAFPSVNIRDLWTIRRDTAEITNRWTGTNGSMARDNSVTRAVAIAPALTMSGTATGVQTVTSVGNVPAFSPNMVGRNFTVSSGVASITSVDSESQITVNVTSVFASTSVSAGAAFARSTASLKVTKVGANGTNFEAALLIPCQPGERLTVHGYYWIKASGGVSGTPAVSSRWGKFGNMKVAALAGAAAAAYLQGIPTQGYADTAGSDWDIGAARDSANVRLVSLSTAATNVWTEFVLTVPNDTAASYGAMQCPEWADHLEFGIILNGAGAGDFNITDLTVSAW